MYTIKRNAKGQEMLITKRDIEKAFAEEDKEGRRQTALAG